MGKTAMNSKGYIDRGIARVFLSYHEKAAEDGHIHLIEPPTFLGR